MFRTVQNAFNSGELDPQARGRSDLKQYYNSLASALNLRLKPQGGAARRSGHRYMGTLAHVLTMLSGVYITITAPNGGTGANANDNDETTTLVTSAPTGTDFVIVHYDLGAATQVDFVDLVGWMVGSGSSTGMLEVQYSADDAFWTTYGIARNLDTASATIRMKETVSARYWRLVITDATGVGTSFTIEEFNLIQATSTLSNARCISFTYSTTAHYKLVISDQNIDVYMGDVYQGSIRIPHTTDMLPYLNWTQDLDVLLLFHENVPTYEVDRVSDTDWKAAAVTWDFIPQYQFTYADSTSPGGGTLTPSAISGIVTLTASAGSPFSAASVGQYINGNGGRARIVSYVSATVVKAYTETPFWDTTAIASGSWDYETGYEDAWSATRGYPRCGTFHKGRLWIGGSLALPQTLWASKINLYFNFDMGQNLDDEAIIDTLATDDVAAINQVFSGRHLQVFTSSAEFYNAAANGIITPNTTNWIRTTSYGSKEGLRVWNVDGATFFVERQGGAVREFLYKFVEQSYQADSMSILASHLMKTPIDSAFRKAQSADVADYYFLVNSQDGSVSVMNTLRTQNIQGWTPWKCDGLYKAVGVDLADIFFVVQRTIGGVTENYIEIVDDNCSTDCGYYQTTGLPLTTVTGLDHLEGGTVHAIADGAYMGTFTVSGGSITLPRAATTSLEIGLRYMPTGLDYELQPNPIEQQLPDGTMVGRRRRVFEVTLKLYNTKSCKINASRVSFQALDGTLLNTAIVPFTGDKTVSGVLGGGTDAEAIVVGDDLPLPFECSAMAMKVSI